MSIHIEAPLGAFAKTVLLPGDPKRAEFIAETFLLNAKRINSVRHASAFTGTYRGAEVSVLGTHMGLPNQNIFVSELIQSYGVGRLIRVGSCGAIQEDLQLNDIMLAIGACTDSGMNTDRFGYSHFAPVADFDLLRQTFETARKLEIPVRVGNIFSTDRFYKEENPDWWKRWAAYGVMALEMETSELYTLAAHFKVQALTILTVSDNLVTRQELSAQERERGFSTMVKLALELAL